MSGESSNYTLNHQEIRDSVTRLCQDFPGEYWRKCDRAQAYPTEFVEALTQAGYLGALVPEKYGGSGLPLSAVKLELAVQAVKLLQLLRMKHTQPILVGYGSE